MALVKITLFPALAYPSADDILPIVDDPDGSPVTKKITHRKLFYQTGLGKSTFCGYEAGAVDDLTDNENSAFGYQALKAVTSGYKNCAFGFEALLALVNGGDNVACGHQALNTLEAGFTNTAVGGWTLKALDTGYSNTAIGGFALTDGEEIYYNVAVGACSLEGILSGDLNVALGYASGYMVALSPYFCYEANNSIFIGAYSCPLNDAETNQIVIGYMTVGLGSNTCLIGNDDITITRLFGDLGVGVDAPQEMIHSAAKVRADTGFDVNGTPGIDASFSILDGDAETSHDFVFTKGILTSYSTS